jgi:hypothetical protein
MSNKKKHIFFSRGTSPEAMAEGRSFCEEVDRLCDENERELEGVAKRSGCTVDELHASHQQAELDARKKIDAFDHKKGLPPMDWTTGASAWLLVGKLPKEDQ